MAGCDELPDPAAKQRAAAALAIGAAASIWPAAAATTAAKGAKAGVPLIVKLLAIGAVGAGTVGGAHYLRTAAEPAPPREVAAVSQPATESARPKAVTQPQRAEEAATPVESLALEAPSEALKPAPSSHSSTDKASIADEMRVLDEARRTLSAGDGSGTIRVLNAYRKQFPHGSFSQEAVLLRIQALVQVGDHAGARALAQRFRDRNPNSPHLRRIETILGEK
jgi:hypothetical protein